MSRPGPGPESHIETNGKHPRLCDPARRGLRHRGPMPLGDYRDGGSIFGIHRNFESRRSLENELYFAASR